VATAAAGAAGALSPKRYKNKGGADAALKARGAPNVAAGNAIEGADPAEAELLDGLGLKLLVDMGIVSHWHYFVPT